MVKENKNQATSRAAVPQNNLQAAQGGTATNSLRRSIRLINKAPINTKSEQEETNGKTSSKNHHSVPHKTKILRRKGVVSLNVLPDDVLIDIASRLPPKAFFQCTSISKSMHTLSTEALRINKHFQPTVCGLFHEVPGDPIIHFAEFSPGFSKEIDTSFKVLPYRDRVSVVDSCNGLLVVKTRKSDVQSYLYVYNPATHNILAAWTLPPPRDFWSFYEVFSLAFDPRVSSKFYMVCFRGWTTDDQEQIDLNFFQTFSSKTGKWRSPKNLGSACKIKAWWYNGTFADGKVYYLATMNKVVSINPSNDSYRVIELPNVNNGSHPQIGQSQGRLHCITVVNQTLQIWILDSQQQWIQKHQLTINQVFGVSDYLFLNYRHIVDMTKIPLALHPGKDCLFVPSVSGMLMAFDLTTYGRQELCYLPQYSRWGPWGDQFIQQSSSY